jgi:hypothetical protein
MEGYLTIKEVAQNWDVTPRTVQILCSDGRIPGAVKNGRSWAIPNDIIKPDDKRITTGEYKDWRCKTRKRYKKIADWEE